MIVLLDSILGVLAVFNLFVVDDVGKIFCDQPILFENFFKPEHLFVIFYPSFFVFLHVSPCVLFFSTFFFFVNFFFILIISLQPLFYKYHLSLVRECSPKFQVKSNGKWLIINQLWCSYDT